MKTNKTILNFIEICKTAGLVVLILFMISYSQNAAAGNNDPRIKDTVQGSPMMEMFIRFFPHVYPNGYNVSCYDKSDGAIDIVVDGGTPPYTYYWSTKDTTQNIANLSADNYDVVVKDANGSSVTGSINLTKPNPLLKLEVDGTVYKYPNEYNVSCIGCYNGSIDVTVTGGSGSYTYLWEDGATTQDRTGLGAGTLNLRVKDASTCSNGENVRIDFELNQPPVVNWSMNGNGGTSPYNQFIGTTDNVALTFRTNNAERLRINGNGNVGIGTNNPTEKLTVAGNGKINDNFNVGKKMTLNGSIKIDSLSGKGFKPDSLSTKSLKLVYADQFGNLTSPGNPAATDNPPGYEFVCGTNISVPWLLGGNNVLDNYTDYIGTCNYWPFRIKTNGLERMRISANGKVGIGTTNPSVLFHVANGNAAFMDNVGIGTTTPKTKLQVNGSSYFGSGMANVSLGSCYGEEIGYGTSYVGFNAYKNSTGNWETQTDGGANGGAVIYANVNGKLIFSSIPSSGGSLRTNLTDNEILENAQMVIYSNNVIEHGGVGIGMGTESMGPNIKLAVNGCIGARKVIITNSPFNWYDCVFEKDYSLPLLKDVEQFINTYKHLPEIPSEAEVNKNGQDLGQMNALLLKKVEELYLYTIDQQKQIDKLKEEIKSLKN